MRRLEHQGDQRRARHQLARASPPARSLPSMRGDDDVEVGAAGGCGPETSVRLIASCSAAQMGAQLGELRRRQRDAGAADHRASRACAAPRTPGAPRRRSARRRRAPRARVEGDELVAAQLVERLAHQGARDLEDVGDLLLGELGARHQAALDDRGDDRIGDPAGGVAGGRDRPLRAVPAAPPAGPRAPAAPGGSPAVEERLGASMRLALSGKVYTLLPVPQAFCCAVSRRTLGKLTTHVLDTANGCPAAGMKVRFSRIESDGAATELRALTLNARRPRRRAAARRQHASRPGATGWCSRSPPTSAGARRAAARSRRSSTRCTLDFGIAGGRPALSRAAARRAPGPTRPIAAASRTAVYTEMDAYLARLGEPAAALGARHHRRSPGSAPRSTSSCLDNGLTPPADPSRPGQGRRRRAMGGARRRLLSPAEVPGLAGAAAREAALVDVGELFDLAHRLRAVHACSTCSTPAPS